MWRFQLSEMQTNKVVQYIPHPFYLLLIHSTSFTYDKIIHILCNEFRAWLSVRLIKFLKTLQPDWYLLPNEDNQCWYFHSLHVPAKPLIDNCWMSIVCDLKNDIFLKKQKKVDAFHTGKELKYKSTAAGANLPIFYKKSFTGFYQHLRSWGLGIYRHANKNSLSKKHFWIYTFWCMKKTGNQK